MNAMWTDGSWSDPHRGVRPGSQAMELVVLTGAGVSAESGVPTFRGLGGVWQRHRPEDLATPQAFQRDPELVWRWYDHRRQLIAHCRPNAAHYTLAEMERVLGERFTLITQNVDGLHREAGNQRILYLHGDIWYVRCTHCDYRAQDRRVPLPEIPPRCPRCGALLRPDVVWFGEMLDVPTLTAAREAARRAAILLVVGTSAVVQPAASLPLETRHAGGRVIEFNLEPTPLTSVVDETVLGPAGETLPRWWRAYQAGRG